VARAPIASPGSRGAQTEVERAAAEPVRRGAVDPAGEEDEHRDEHRVDARVVEESLPGAREQDAGDPGEEDEGEDGLLPGARGLVRVVAESGEHGARRLEDGERPQPPLPLGARLDDGCLRVHAVRLATSRVAYGRRVYGSVYGMIKTTVYLPEPLKKRLETVAHQEGMSEAQLVRTAIEHYTTEHVRPRPKLPLFRTLEPITDWDEAMRGFGED
jgi:hypothetical protein